MIDKIARTIEMSFDIPESEKKEAKIALEQFDKVLASLDVAKKHLSIVYEPFKQNEKSSPEDIYKYRDVFFKYKEKIKENYNKVKSNSFLAITKLNYFSTDTHISELINTFRDSIENIEQEVEILLDILDDLKSNDFKDKLLKSIDSVKRNSIEIDKLINERIIDYINKNILSNNWMTNTSNELKTKIENKIPYITQLFEEHQKALEQK